jgi:hypothetical protein
MAATFRSGKNTTRSPSVWAGPKSCS